MRKTAAHLIILGISKDGYISVINQDAEILQNIVLLDTPEISSLKISM